MSLLLFFCLASCPGVAIFLKYPIPTGSAEGETGSVWNLPLGPLWGSMDSGFPKHPGCLP